MCETAVAQRKVWRITGKLLEICDMVTGICEL